jgi:proline iminopeptidase
MPRAQTVTVAGGRSFEFISRGRGPATLLVHPGGPGFTFHYLRGLLRLADSHLRVVLFNPRGVGRSWRPGRPSAYTIENQADDVESIRRALEIKELHLLGFSAGGWAALEYAHRHPDRLTSLLLCSTTGSVADIRVANRYMLSCASPAQRTRLRELTAKRAFRTAEYRDLAAAIQNPFQQRFLDSVPRDLKASRLSEEVYRAMMSRDGDEFAIDGNAARWDGRKYFHQIAVPVLVLVGRFDFCLDGSIDMANRIRTAHLRILPRSSHLAILEQPREFLNQIDEFLADVTGE